MVAAIGAAAAIGGAAISSSATRSAANTQAGATREANDLQRYMYDNNVALQMPTINTGNTARDRLSYLLGLSPTGFSGGAGGAPALTYDSVREQLLPQFTSRSQGAATQVPATMNQGQSSQEMGQASFAPGGYRAPMQTVPGAMTDSIDESGLDAAIRARLAQQEQERQAAITAAGSDPNFGRLAQQYVPETFKFTADDFLANKDPGYEWRLQQGQKALDRQGLASGRFLSGAQLQAASNFNQGAASQEFGNAYSRAMSTFGTNEGNRFGAYQANFNNSVNPLLALAGAATLGSQNLGAAGASMAGAVGSNLTNQANATGAAAIAGANSINSGISSAVGGYQRQQQQQQQNNFLTNLLTGVNNNPVQGNNGLGGLDSSTVYGAGSGWGQA